MEELGREKQKRGREMLALSIEANKNDRTTGKNCRLRHAKFKRTLAQQFGPEGQCMCGIWEMQCGRWACKVEATAHMGNLHVDTLPPR